jgi:hypothetical protein
MVWLALLLVRYVLLAGIAFIPSSSSSYPLATASIWNETIVLYRDCGQGSNFKRQALENYTREAAPFQEVTRQNCNGGKAVTSVTHAVRRGKEHC